MVTTAPRFYTAEDIQTILNVKKSKAYEIMRSFALKGRLFRDGGTMRVRREFFEEWLTEQEIKTAREMRGKLKN